MRIRSTLAFVSSFALLACSGSSGGTGTSGAQDGAAILPATGDALAFSRLTNAIPVSITAGGATGYAFVDTGNPWALLDPATFPAVAALPTSGAAFPSILIASQTSSDSYVIPSTGGDLSGDSAFNLDANVGCSVICDFSPAFNYRDAVFTLAAPGASVTLPSGVQAAVTVPFTFEGGGTEDGVVVPKSRIVVPVSLEGHSYSMILDTGASEVTVSAGAYATLTSDGRTQLDGGTATTATGTSTTTITRAASLSVGGVTVTSLVVAHDTAFDTNLTNVSTDVGHTIDGSLGGTFLHNFFVSIDYASQTVTFARYTDLSFAIDPAEQIGITLAQSEAGGYVVDTSTGAAASAGIQPDDVIVAIGGQDLSTLSLLQIATLVFGPVGTSVNVTFGAAATVSNQTIALPIEETLPLPSP